MGEEIARWSKERINQINEHAADQRKLLGQEFERKKRFLGNTRKRFMEHVHAQEKKKDNEQLQRLRNECNALKITLAAFEYPDRPFSLIQLATQKQLGQENQVEKTVHETDENQSQNESRNDHDNDVMNSIDKNDGWSPRTRSGGAQQTR
jgi:hypothetical protein